ncbi:MAG: PAS domain-containing protein [Oceanospirillales bacterium]|uniref:Fis family sigma54 specific transcriptional regulator n=1 Tax=Marinobacterium halophilum TaxID=267374 RepID=A0A2P8EUR2_9GAMM|nr:sigma 54-interacting transcriptional regulator [Marinobacterium halophilum]MBR9827295.1 PAS domain-containing protein [Oceanospirillales bacterium]PSL13194.1 Fis family sigma54 specific transcriptional regulator [Marinobacterium halophilum]
MKNGAFNPEVILEAIPEPAAILSTEYEILATNAAYRRSYKPQGAVVGRTCFDVSHGYQVPCDQAGEACPLKRCRETGQRQRVLHLHNTPQGEEHVDVEMAPLEDDRQQLIGFLEVMHQVKAARAHVSDHEGLVGRAPAFTQMLSLVHRAAPSEITVLLLGESGTGKELVARALHDSSPRAGSPFVTVECSGLSEGLFESELFGHERGAFTGAVSRKKGLVEAVRGGTLFLDEIGEIPLSLQVKLLRLIETGTFRPVGSVELQHADFRLVCATHCNLKQMVEEGHFRQDLYYRISAFPVPLPPLRERPTDLPLLSAALLKRLPGGDTVELADDTLAQLSAYAFPGNIRELRNVLERGILLADGGVILPQHLPAEVTQSRRSGADLTIDSGLDQVPLMPLEQLESAYLASVVRRFGGERRALARQLGVSERTLYRKLKP